MSSEAQAMPGPQRPGERVLDAIVRRVARVCPLCGAAFQPSRPHQVYCCDGHRIEAWKARQAALPLEPEPIRVAVPPHNPALVRRLRPAALHILGLLGDFLPHSRRELAHVGGARYSARVAELRNGGHVILGPSRSPRHRIWDVEPAGADGLEMYRLVR